MRLASLMSCDVIVFVQVVRLQTTNHEQVVAMLLRIVTTQSSKVKESAVRSLKELLTSNASFLKDKVGIFSLQRSFC